jgi:hypothetical protein
MKLKKIAMQFGITVGCFVGAHYTAKLAIPIINNFVYEEKTPPPIEENYTTFVDRYRNGQL